MTNNVLRNGYFCTSLGIVTASRANNTGIGFISFFVGIAMIIVGTKWISEGHTHE